MTTAAHTAVGYLIAHVFINAGLLPVSMEAQVVGLGILAANAPDLDTIAVWRALKHRTRSPFHKPFFWANSIMPLIVFAAATGQPFYFAVFLLAFTGVLSHFILDSIDFSPGITWLWPLSSKRFSIWKTPFTEPKTVRDLIGQLKHNPILKYDLAFSLAVFLLARGGR